MTGVKPDFDSATNTLTIPDLDGVEYRIGGKVVEGQIEIRQNTTVRRSAKPGYQLARGAEKVFEYKVSKAEPKPAETDVEVDVDKVEDPADPVEVTSPGNTPENPAQGTPRFTPRQP